MQYAEHFEDNILKCIFLKLFCFCLKQLHTIKHWFPKLEAIYSWFMLYGQSLVNGIICNHIMTWKESDLKVLMLWSMSNMLNILKTGFWVHFLKIILFRSKQLHTIKQWFSPTRSQVFVIHASGSIIGQWNDVQPYLRESAIENVVCNMPTISLDLKVLTLWSPHIKVTGVCVVHSH